MSNGLHGASGGGGSSEAPLISKKPPRPSAVQPLPSYSHLSTSPPHPQQQALLTPSQSHPANAAIGGASPYTNYLHSPPGTMAVSDAAMTPGGSLLPTSGSFAGEYESGGRARSMTGGYGNVAPSLVFMDDDADDLMHEERPFCSCCAACRSCACARCLSHCWFLTACCGFVLLSSLPRLLTIVDFIVTLLIYSLSFAGRTQPSLSFWQFLQDDFEHYSFQRSGGSLVILAFVRMVILFWVFAYRFHLRPAALRCATGVAVTSVLFVFIKFALNQNPHILGLLVWSLSITCLEYGVWLALRRQRIKHPHLRIEHMHMPLGMEARDTAAATYPLTPKGGHAAEDDHDEHSVSHMEAGLIGSGASSGPAVLPSSFPTSTSSTALSRSSATDILPSSAATSRQAQSYHRLGGNEEEEGERRTGGLPPLRMPGSFLTAQSFGSLGSSVSGSLGAPGFGAGTGSSGLLGGPLSIPRLSMSPVEREVEPTALADADSLFMQIDSLSVHFKLSVNGVTIVGRDVERQAREAVTQALEEAKTKAATATSSAQGSTTASYEEDALSLAGATAEEAPLRGVATYSADASAASAGSAAASTSAAPAAPHLFRHPVVLLHGFGNSLYQWRSVWPSLASQCAVLLAFDRPGFGLTSRPLKDANGGYGSFVAREEDGGTGTGRTQLKEQANPYTAEYSVHLLLTLLSRLGISESHRSVLVGHSTGATVALRAAIVAPHRCLGLFLVSPHVLTSGFPDLIKSLLKTKLGALITQQLVRSEMGEVALKRAWYDASRIPAEVLFNYQRGLAVKHHMEALIEIAAAASTGADTVSGRDPLANLALHLHKLAASGLPICLLHGLQDKLVDVTESVRVYKQLKAADAAVTLIKIDHCGHVPHEEVPGFFLEHLYGYCNEIEMGAEHYGQQSTGPAVTSAKGAYTHTYEQPHEHSHEHSQLSHHSRSHSPSHSRGGSDDDEHDDMRDL